jgi:hypothetical protein
MVAASVAASCGGSGGNATGSPGSDGGGRDATSSAPTHTGVLEDDSSADVSGFDASADADGGVCGAIPATDLPVYASPAMVRVTGAGLSAVLCPGAAYAYVEPVVAPSAVPFLLLLALTEGSGAPGGFEFESPVGAHDGGLTVLLGLDSLSPGTYSSPAAQQCGDVGFQYSLAAASVDCDGGTSTACPTGCTLASGSTCGVVSMSGPLCHPNPHCVPVVQSVSCAARGASDCAADADAASQTPQGSWTLVLTSITGSDAGGGTGLANYAPHGTLTATLVVAGGTDTASLSASF